MSDEPQQPTGSTRAPFALRDRPPVRTGIAGTVLATLLVLGVFGASGAWAWMLATAPPPADSHSWEERIPDVELTDQQKAVAAAHPAHPRALPVLTFHEVSSRTPEQGAGEFVVPTKRFVTMMAILKEAGYQTVSLSQVEAFIAGKGTLPPKPILLTFDDGHATSLAVADPVLEKYDFHAVVFPITGFVPDTEAQSYYLTRQQVDELAATGRWEFGSHTHRQHYRKPVKAGAEPEPMLDHRILQADGTRETLAQWRHRVGTDLTESQQWLTTHLGGPATSLAYPYGAWGQQPGNEEVKKQLRQILVKNGIRLAFIGKDVDPATAAIAGIDPLAVPRLSMRADTDPDNLLYIIEDTLPSPFGLPAKLDWRGQDARCTGATSHKDTVHAVTVDADSPVFAQCRPELNPALWKNYGVTATVTGVTDHRAGTVALRDGRTWSQAGHVEVVVEPGRAQVLEQTPTGTRTLGHTDLPTANRHTVRLAVQDHTVTAEVDGRRIRTTPAAHVEAGGLSFSVVGAEGAVTFGDITLTGQG